MVKDERISFTEAEAKFIPANHAEIGSHLALKWKYPEALTQMIRYHHEVANDETTPAAMIIHVADAIVNVMEAEINNELIITPIHPKASELLGNKTKEASLWLSSVSEDIDAACSILSA